MSDRNAILAAASQEIVKHGYAGSSLSCIASHLGVTKGALVRQFPTKEAIANGIFETFEQAVREERTIAEALYPESGIRALLRFLLGLTARSDSCLQIGAAIALVTDRTSPLFADSSCFEGWRHSVCGFLTAARHNGELAESVSPTELTEFIATVNLGRAILETRDRREPGAVADPSYLPMALASYGISGVRELMREVESDMLVERAPSSGSV